MFNCSCTINTLVAWLFWAAAVALSALYAFVAEQFGTAAILCMSAGATLHVRGFIYSLERREVEAFELGRESVRSIR